MTKTAGQELLAVAKLGAPRGLNGFLKLHSYSGEYDHLKKLKVALVAPAKTPNEAKTMRIKAVEVGDWGMSVAFEGYESPEKARALTGLELFAPREGASQLRANEWYIHDLVGLKLMVSGIAVGEIVGVLDGGADPLLEIHVNASGSQVLVPFRSEFIGAVDCGAGTMELLAEWLLE
ncbi:MAG: ribosome maturation factor RimM [Spirochaetales bacterium]|jgi:16S rRNA processing protein RimM